MFVAGLLPLVSSRKAICLLALVLCAGVLTTLPANAAVPSGISASIAGPTCGKEVTLTIGSTRTSTTHFYLKRSTRSTAWSEVYLNGAKSSVVKLAVTKTETFSVVFNNEVIATKSVAPSATPCGTSVKSLPALVSGISAALDNPSCGPNAPATLNNGSSSSAWFSISRQGRLSSDVIVALAGSYIASFTTVVTAANQTVKVSRNGQTLVSKVLSPQAACGSTTTTTSTTTSTSTTVKPTTTSTTSSSTTSTTRPSTTTTTPTTTTTTTLPTCTSADKLANWGCPVRVENFDGSSLNTSSTGWMTYHSPDVRYPRSRDNIAVSNGELQLIGTYNQTTKTIMGAGIGDKFSQQYGRWEVRAKSDVGNGYSAVALLWPAGTGKWPDDGEIDIFEIPRGERVRAWSAVHNLATNSQQGKWANVDATQWHSYVTEWTPTVVNFYIDNVLVFSMTQQHLVPKTAPMRMALQFDAQRITDGCSGWYQCPDATTPAKTVMHVDYMKVWKYSN